VRDFKCPRLCPINFICCNSSFEFNCTDLYTDLCQKSINNSNSNIINSNNDLNIVDEQMHANISYSSSSSNNNNNNNDDYKLPSFDEAIKHMDSLNFIIIDGVKEPVDLPKYENLP